jgi:serine/threonine protein phosphatase PrpC
MRYRGAAVTDIGTVKQTNQDSICIKVADTEKRGNIAMCVLCDGMGGLEKGEVASGTVIRVFEKWFMEQLPEQLPDFQWQKVAEEWEHLIKEYNYKISEYGQKNAIRLGTTVTVLLLTDKEYVIAHVGDSRVYQISHQVEQLTEDQTYVAREVKRGNMTPEQARKDRRRSVLLQCVGASPIVTPEILHGSVEEDAIYMLCSDGFRHELSEDEMYDRLQPEKNRSEDEMRENSRFLVEQVKQRGEKDNISIATISCSREG